MTQEQDEFKHRIKLWLKSRSYTYSWLAEKCFVTESTVRNWMARRRIPAAKLHIIRNLMSQQEHEQVAPRESANQPREDEAVRLLLERQAYTQGKTLREYLADAGLSL